MLTEDAELSSSGADFVRQLPSIPWFASIGQPFEGNETVARLESWDAWPGPEDDAVGELSIRHQTLYDTIMEKTPDSADELTLLWERIHKIVIQAASPTIPCDQSQNAWHGPNAAVWQAAWTAGLIGLCLQTRRSIPRELQEQWSWFVRGHWPSGFAGWMDYEVPGPLLVY